MATGDDRPLYVAMIPLTETDDGLLALYRAIEAFRQTLGSGLLGRFEVSVEPGGVFWLVTFRR